MNALYNRQTYRRYKRLLNHVTNLEGECWPLVQQYFPLLSIIQSSMQEEEDYSRIQGNFFAQTRSSMTYSCTRIANNRRAFRFNVFHLATIFRRYYNLSEQHLVLLYKIYHIKKMSMILMIDLEAQSPKRVGNSCDFFFTKTP